MDSLELQVQLDQQGFLGVREEQDLLDQRVPREPQDLAGQPERQDQLDHLVQVALQGLQVKQDLLEVQD